ncbi:hypothetical protein [Euhalothece natronophila]|uniref:hypothetical protein n=1 Tax=Euhalothece natronophila TaxID=577489 RepID=UPI0016486646|nr:hypothetical protein [Euhalothece natronophila]
MNDLKIQLINILEFGLRTVGHTETDRLELEQACGQNDHCTETGDNFGVSRVEKAGNLGRETRNPAL